MRQLQILRDFRRLLPVLISSVAGIIIILNRLTPDIDGVQALSFEILTWTTILAAVAVLVGVLSVAMHHVNRIRTKDTRWPYSIVLLLGLAIPPLLSLYGNIQGQPEVYRLALFQDFVRFVYTPLSVSLLALLTFFAVSAAIRAVGSGNREALVLVSVALIMLLLQLPLLADLPVVGDTVLWIQQYLALAGLRGLVFGAAIGAIIASLRIIVGLDRPYLDR